MLINKGASFDLLDPANRATASIILSFSIIASDFISRLILGSTFCYNNGFSEGYSKCYAPGLLFLLFKMLSLGGALAAIMCSITAMFGIKKATNKPIVVFRAIAGLALAVLAIVMVVR